MLRLGYVLINAFARQSFHFSSPFTSFLTRNSKQPHHAPPFSPCGQGGNCFWILQRWLQSSYPFFAFTSLLSLHEIFPALISGIIIGDTHTIDSGSMTVSPQQWEWSITKIFQNVNLGFEIMYLKLHYNKWRIFSPIFNWALSKNTVFRSSILHFSLSFICFSMTFK